MSSDSAEDTCAVAPDLREFDGAGLVERIRAWGAELGFARVGVAGIDVAQASQRLRDWLADGRHGAMDYMERHAHLRADPQQVLPGALRVISARLNYLAAKTPSDWQPRELRRVDEPGAAIVSIYARGRDYHKVLRQRLQSLASHIEAEV